MEGKGCLLGFLGAEERAGGEGELMYPSFSILFTR